MMAPPAYLRYMAAADHHVQVEILDRASLDGPRRELAVTARVRRVFKSTRLRVDDQLTFGLKTFRSPDKPAWDAGGWIEYEEFRKTRYLEVFLDGDVTDLSVAASGALHYRIDLPTDKARVRRPSRLKAILASAMYVVLGRIPKSWQHRSLLTK